ncbi:hypothetical protein ABBQ38_001325 [Trebouxia sp. C0009 RCD-2024]
MQVLNADIEAQKNVAPFFKHRVLRAIVESLANSPDDDFEAWAKNKMVLTSLREAQRLLDDGHITEEEMENALLHHVAKDTQLVERRQGNVRYKRRHFTEALEHYSKAASMLEGLSGRAEEEQQEVDANLGSVYLNIAAVHLQQQYYGEAVKWCTKALKLNRSNDRALLRRAKAHMGRHNYQKAVIDLSMLLQQDPANLDAHTLMQSARAAEYAET